MNGESNSSVFSVAHLNLRSIFTGFDEFVDIVATNSFDVVAVSETWLNVNVTDDAVRMNGYNFYRCDRIDGRGGGVGVYVRDSLQSELLPLQMPQRVDGLESLWVRIRVKFKSFCVVGVIYRTKNNILDSVNFLDQVLPEVLALYGRVIVLGDLNINMMPDCLPNPMSEVFDTLGFTQVINEPTRVTQKTSTLLDPIFVTDEECVVSVGTLDAENISDHKLTYCKLNIFAKLCRQKFITYRDFKHFNEDNFYTDLQRISWDDIYYIEDIEDKVRFINFHLSGVFRDHCPLRTVRVNKPPAPWLTPALKALMIERDRALAQFKRNKTQESYQYYKEMRNLTLYSVRREKLGYLEYLETQKNAKSLWKGLQQCNVHTGSKDTPRLPAHLANVNDINEYFLSVFRKSDNCAGKIYYYSNNKRNLDLNFNFLMETPESICRCVNSIKSNAAGNDGLTLFMLKLSLPVILYHLTHIVNCCLESGYFPESWKESIVCPVAKVKNPLTVRDLRPISLLPVMSKVLERAVHTQVSEYLLTNELLPLHQSGFRRGHSTSTALLNLTDSIIRAIDKNMAVISVSLDYSKAFDVLDHNLLCAKLHYLGFADHSVQFFYSYLSGRRQRVRMNDVCSTAGKIISGVPQGSILGPLLFLIYTFDIFQTAVYSSVQSYADDTQLLHFFEPSDPESAAENLNQDLMALSVYSDEHNLRLNPDKTQVLLFCKENRRPTLSMALRLRLADQDLLFSDCAKNLGLCIDTHLRFREHVRVLLQKSYAKMKVLYANRFILNFKMRKKLCESLVLSSFHYCSIVYYPCLDALSRRRLQYVQNVCCRFIFHLRKYDHISLKINELKWLNFANTVQLHFVIFLMRLLGTSVPIYLREKLVSRNLVHDRYIRRPDRLTMPQHRTALFQRSFTYNAVNIYNTMNPELKTCTIGRLRRLYREELLNKQNSQT